MGKKLFFFLAGIFFLILFFAFTLWVRADQLRSFDFDTTVRLQNITPVKADSFFSFLSVIGRFEFTTTALAILLLIWSKFKFNKLIRAGFIMGLLAFAHVVELVGKSILEQPGPPNMFLRSQFSEFPGLYVHTAASYPSGHSLRIVFLGIIYFYIIYKSKLSQQIKLGSYLAILSISSLMLYSRISLGEHWTTDVMGGTILGISGAFLALLFL